MILFNYPKAVSVGGQGILDIKYFLHCSMLRLFEGYFSPINILDVTQEFSAETCAGLNVNYVLLFLDTYRDRGYAVA